VTRRPTGFVPAPCARRTSSSRLATHLVTMKTKSIFLIAGLLCAVAGAPAADSTPAPTPLVTQSADKLIQVLQADASRKEKADACRELAVVGDSKAVPVLVGLLANEELSHMARYALETIPGESVNQALRDELTKLQGRPLIGVIGSLGVRRDPEAVKPLSALLLDSDPQVAQAAARALGSIGTAGAVRAIETAFDKTAPANRLAFYEGLFRCAEALAAKGKTSDAIALYDRLRKQTEVPNQVRAGAFRGSIVVRGKKGLGLLKESLGSGDSILVDAAVRASLEMPGPEVTEILAAQLPSLWPESKIVVIRALGSRGDLKALPALYTQSKQGPTGIRVAAIRAISAIGHPLSVKILVELVEEPEREISQAAQDGLAGIPVREADAAALDFLKSPKADRRLVGIDLVGRRRMVVALPVLLTAATDADPKVRSSALQRVGKLGASAEVPALIKVLLRSTEAQDIDGSAAALTGICIRAGTPASATAQIASALTTATPAQKAALLGVLGALGGDKALAAVRAALADPNPEVHGAAVQALTAWPDLTAAPDLLQIVRSTTNSAERDPAFNGYVKLVRESGATADEKLKLLTQAMTLAGSSPEKILVLAGLGDIPSGASLRLVTPYLSDPAVVEEAGAVAVRIAEKLDPRFSAEIGVALNQVLKAAKSPQVLDPARKRMEQLKLPIEP
jgi:HEAT repeat protein